MQPKNAIRGVRSVLLFLTAFVCGLEARVAWAVDVCSEPTGSLAITLRTNTDTYVSIPFTRPPAFCGMVQTASSAGITVQGVPGWTNGQWSQVNSNGYYPNYVVLTSGTKEGAVYTITNNSSDTLNLIVDCEDLTGVGAGDQLAIMPYWTLGTVFPGGSGIIPSTSSTVSGRRTQVLFPIFYPPLISFRPSYVYFFYNNAWRRQGISASSNYNDAVIWPGYFIVRQATNLTDTTTFTASGNVVQYTTRTCLYADSVTTNWDHFVANYHSTTQTLDQSNLAGAFAVSDPSVSPPSIKDLLLVYDNAAVGINKTPAHVYFYYANHWADLNNPPYTVDRGGDPVFVPGTGVTIRRRPGSTSVWVNPP